MVKEYKNKNILLKGGFRRQVQLNYGLFSELIPWSCLIDEFQYVLFGTYVPFKHSLEQKRLDFKREMKELAIKNMQKSTSIAMQNEQEKGKAPVQAPPPVQSKPGLFYDQILQQRPNDSRIMKHREIDIEEYNARQNNNKYAITIDKDSFPNVLVMPPDKNPFKEIKDLS